MVQFLIGILGLFIIATIGYITINAFIATDRFRLYEKIFLSPICFFIIIAVIYIINFVTAGRVLTNRLLFLLIILSFTILTFIFGFSNIKSDFKFSQKIAPKDGNFRFYSKAACFVIFLIIIVIVALIPINSGINLNSDAGRHIMRTHQLINGFPFSHTFPYQNVPSNHYPNLIHTALAFFVKLMNIHVFDAYYILFLLQAILLPVGMFILIHIITQNFWIAFLCMTLSSLYGGHFNELSAYGWWLNAAIERLKVSHITRMLSLVFFLGFLISFLKTSTHEIDNRSSVLAGLILGFTGLAHTYAFSFLFLLMTINLLLHLKEGEALKKGAIILLIGTAVAMSGYLPTLWEKLISHSMSGIEQLWYCEIDPAATAQGQILIFPFRFLIHYGVVGIMALLSLIYLKESKNRNLIILLFCAAMSIFILTYLKETLITVYHIKLPYHPSQHKYGKLIFLAFVILSGVFINDLFRSFKRAAKQSALMNIGIIALLTLFVSAGTITTLKATVKLSSNTKSISRANARLRHQRNIAAVIKKRANLNDVVALPDKLGKHFAMMSGLDILYLDHPRTYSHCRKLANQILFASEGQRKQFERINDFDFDDIFRKILSKYQIRFLVVPNAHKDRYDHFEFLQAVDNGTWTDNQIYLVYKVNQAIEEINILSEHDSVLAAIFQNDENYDALLGYYPIQKNRMLIPKILNFRDFTVTGLTWAQKDLWISILEKKKLFNIDPESGKVIRILKNPVEQPGGITWDGKALWSTDTLKKRLIKLDYEKGNILDSFASPAFEPKGLVWGRNYLWHADFKNEEIHKFSPKNGKLVAKYKSPRKPIGVAWRDGTLWVSTWWRGKIVQFSLQDDYEQITYFNNGYRITNIAWGTRRLWGVDRHASTLIEFQDIRTP